jgi:AraC-like DNA-binding protein
MTRQLSELLEAPVVNNLEFNGHIDLTMVLGRRLAALGDLIFDSAATYETAVTGPVLQNLFEATMIMLLEAVPNNYTTKLRRPLSAAAPRHLKRAIEYMHDNLGSAISMADLAKHSGTSVRALQTAFQTFKRTTPTNYLRTIRLAGVREALQLNKNGLLIAEIARTWGFSHMGHFSADYLRAFGESPSDTLKNRMGISGYQTKGR